MCLRPAGKFLTLSVLFTLAPRALAMTIMTRIADNLTAPWDTLDTLAGTEKKAILSRHTDFGSLTHHHPVPQVCVAV